MLGAALQCMFPIKGRLILAVGKQLWYWQASSVVSGVSLVSGNILLRRQGSVVWARVG